MRPFIPLLALACASLSGSALAQTADPATAPSASAAPVASPDPAITTRAKDWLHRSQTGNIDRSQLDAAMNAALTDDIVKEVAAQVGPFGDPTDFTFVDKKTASGNTAYIYRVTFKSSSLYFIFSLDSTGKISGLHLRPT